MNKKKRKSIGLSMILVLIACLILTPSVYASDDYYIILNENGEISPLQDRNVPFEFEYNMASYIPSGQTFGISQSTINIDHNVSATTTNDGNIRFQLRRSTWYGSTAEGTRTLNVTGGSGSHVFSFSGLDTDATYFFRLWNNISGARAYGEGEVTH